MDREGHTNINPNKNNHGKDFCNAGCLHPGKKRLPQFGSSGANLSARIYRVYPAGYTE